MREVGSVGAHLSLWVIAFLLALLLRFEFTIPSEYVPHLAVWIPCMLALRMAAFFGFRLFTDVWRFSGARALRSILGATLVSSIGYFTLVALLGYDFHPRSIIVLEAGI